MRFLCHVRTTGLVLLLALGSPLRADRLVLVAGGGSGGDGVPAARAKLVAPFGVDFDQAGTMYLVELTGQRVLKVGRDGLLTTLAGAAGEKGEGGDGGPARQARFNGMHSLAAAT